MLGGAGAVRAAVWLLALASALGVEAYETDPFQNRAVATADAREVLNREVNRTLAELVEHWRGPATEARMVDAIYHRIGGRHWVDKLERWAMRSPEVEKLPTPRRRSVYAGHPFWSVRVAAVFGIGPSFRVAGVLVGSDKIGHFLSQGRKFWRRYQRSHDEALAARQSAFTERAIFGSATTGVYSNADLVANYEGHRFYRSLFEDDVVAGKPAILVRDGERWRIQRPFDFADHVNPWWDEALYPNAYDGLLAPVMQRRLRQLCPEVAARPELWTVSAEVDAALAARYALLDLRDRRDWRMTALCADASGGDGDRGVAR
jgi:hypothetical protein